jgi:hypothetical protein
MTRFRLAGAHVADLVYALGIAYRTGVRTACHHYCHRDAAELELSLPCKGGGAEVLQGAVPPKLARHNGGGHV